ncbi:hypothetical protein Q0F98_31920 [Paenibacillus amylolyticus]|nr:hypothetical protein Q0F98_31920 [Paenibacillus amylolyticus]
MKQEQQKKEAAKRAQQEKYDKQAKYEAYLVWKKRMMPSLQDRKRSVKRLLKLNVNRRLLRKPRSRKKRAQNVVTLIAHYNKTYNAQKGRKIENAEAYARDFKNLYNTDAAYFKGVGKVAARMSAINKFLSNTSYTLPNL